MSQLVSKKKLWRHTSNLDQFVFYTQCVKQEPILLEPFSR